MRTSATVLGRLLCGESGPDLAGPAGEDGAAVPVGAGWSQRELDHVLGRVSLTEAAFCGSEPAALQARYTAARFMETGPGADHLGVQLRFLATLADDDARDFLGAHLGRWVDAALDALEAEAGESPLSTLFDAVRTLVAEELDLLRPTPEAYAVDGPVVSSAVELADHLLDPNRCGGWISAVTVAEVAQDLDLGPITDRAALRLVASSAEERGDLAALASMLRGQAEAWVETWVARQWVRPLSAPLFRPWKARAQATLTMLTDFANDAALAPRFQSPAGPDAATAVMTVHGDPTQLQTAVDAVRSLLVAQGLDVTVAWEG